MMQAEIRGIYDIAAFVLLTAEALVKSYCFYRFVKPFIISSDRINGPCPPKDIEASPHKREKSAVCGAAAYFLIIMLFYITGFTMDVYLQAEIISCDNIFLSQLVRRGDGRDPVRFSL